MNEEKGYNGWKNYETWCVGLWIDNDYSLYHLFREVAKVHSVSDTSLVVKEWLEEGNPIQENPTVYTDLLNASISEVDFYEIAKHLQEE